MTQRFSRMVHPGLHSFCDPTSQPSPPGPLSHLYATLLATSANEGGVQINPKGWFLISLRFPYHLSTSKVLHFIFPDQLSILLRVYLPRNLRGPLGLYTLTQCSKKALVQTCVPALAPSLKPPFRT